MFGFPKDLVNEVNNSTYDYHYLGDPEHQGSSTNFMDFDIIKIAETPEEIDKYFEKFDDYILRLRDREENLDTKEDEEIDKDKKIEDLEKELAKTKEELNKIKKNIEDDK
jgi:predicted RNase H-like nuclease (RuvC/YqgF family)